jgi:hypothetical protein
MALPNLGYEARLKRESEAYFANFPYDEKTVREVISALKNEGYFGKKDFDPETISLEEILAPPTQNLGGVRIMSLTEGPGKHRAILGWEYEVKEKEVLATIDDIGFLSGKIATYEFKRGEKGLKLTKRYVHCMS